MYGSPFGAASVGEGDGELDITLGGWTSSAAICAGAGAQAPISSEIKTNTVKGIKHLRAFIFSPHVS
jgi:hypothetical protein